jgi:hypothetical protein
MLFIKIVILKSPWTNAGVILYVKRSERVKILKKVKVPTSEVPGAERGKKEHYKNLFFNIWYGLPVQTPTVK